MNNPILSVIVVSYHSTELLGRCLSALYRSTVTDALEVIVVDNASPGFDVAAMRRQFPSVHFIASPRNLTFTGGVNLGYVHARGSHILLLNPDTEVEPKALEEGLRLLEDRSIACVAAYLLEPTGGLQAYYRRLPRPLDIPVMLLPKVFGWTPRGRTYLMKGHEIRGVDDVEQPPGAFLMIRRADLDSPPLDPQYFNLVSDVALSRHLRSRGRIVVSDRVRCLHVRGGAGLGDRAWENRVRLYHDLTWGARHYFAPYSRAIRAYLGSWLLLFWMIRIAQSARWGIRAMLHTMSVGRSALSGVPPRY